MNQLLKEISKMIIFGDIKAFLLKVKFFIFPINNPGHWNLFNWIFDKFFFHKKIIISIKFNYFIQIMKY